MKSVKSVGKGGAKGSGIGGIGESSVGRAVFAVREEVEHIFDKRHLDNWAQDEFPTSWREANSLEASKGLKAWWYIRDKYGVRCETNALLSDRDLFGPAFDPNEIAFSKVTLLSRTSKMSCFSWDLPAGPPKLGGTCPACTIGFDSSRLGLGKNASDSALLKAASALLGSIDPGSDFAEEIAAQSAKQLRRRFICNGCYALKGNYWHTNAVLAMKWRKLWADWALRTGLFVPHMTRLIQESQTVASRARARTSDPLKRGTLPHPDFFRIHDAGDFFSRDYFFAWIEVARALPNIWFWAPTRMWSTPSGADWLQQAVRKGIPKNLALRPSTLFFDCPAPEIPGLAMGTGSNEVQFGYDRRGKVRVQALYTGPAFVCPAYYPTHAGGGSVPKSKDNPAPQVKPHSFTPYPKADPLEAGKTYDALWDVDAQRFVLDSKGRPRASNATSIRQAERDGLRVETVLAQSYDASGSCGVAKDLRGKDECRVCWGVSGGKANAKATSLPVVYSKH